MKRLRIAIQKEGRLAQQSLSLLDKMGTAPEKGGRSFVIKCQKFPLDVLLLRDDDIPHYVESGASDLGIVGENVILESGTNVKSLVDLPFGKCNLCLLSDEKFDLSRLSQVKNLKIATSYPKILSTYLNENNILAQIITLSGSVELAPRMNIADIVFDIVSSGQTAQMNGLTQQQIIFQSKAQLIEKISDEFIDRDFELQELKDEFLLRLLAATNADKLRYLMMNVPQKNLEEITKNLPAARSPSILPLADQIHAAVHIVLTEDEMWKNLNRFKKLGATDIILSDVQAYIK